MRILIVNDTVLPARLYGGAERVIWWLGKELVRLGHKVTFLIKKGSSCPFAEVLYYDSHIPLNDQIPIHTDFVHLHLQPPERIHKPYLVTHHGNWHNRDEFDINTVFVSRNHAGRHASQTFVYNGLDPEEYGPPNLDKTRKYLLFLAYAKRPAKNLKHCAYIARKTDNVLAVVGGWGAWWRWRPWIEYKGFLGGEEKNAVLRHSKALLFPVRWHEPCAISLLEALYFGMPVFGTTYGCLPEIVTPKTGFLSNSLSELVEAVRFVERYDPHFIHKYALDKFSVQRMTRDYLNLYEKVLRGHTLNPHPPRNPGNHRWGRLLPMED